MGLGEGMSGFWAFRVQKSDIHLGLGFPFPQHSPIFFYIMLKAFFLSTFILITVSTVAQINSDSVAREAIKRADAIPEPPDLNFILVEIETKICDLEIWFLSETDTLNHVGIPSLGERLDNLIQAKNRQNPDTSYAAIVWYLGEYKSSFVEIVPNITSKAIYWEVKKNPNKDEVRFRFSLDEETVDYFLSITGSLEKEVRQTGNLTKVFEPRRTSDEKWPIDLFLKKIKE